MRRVDDGDVRDLMVRGSARVRAIVSYRLHAGDRLAEVSNRTRAAVSDVSTRARTFHVVAAIGLAFLIAFGSRSFVLDRVPEVGSFQDWPGAGALWSTFFAPWRYAMMGADTAASPVFGLMALLSTVLLGDSDLGRTLVVAGALPLGAFGAYRLVRPLAGTAAPAVAASVAYAINPIVRNAIRGRAARPARVLRAGTVRDERAAAGVGGGRGSPHAACTRPRRSCSSFSSRPRPGRPRCCSRCSWWRASRWRGRWSVARTLFARSAAAAAVATLGAAILLAPWSLTLFGADPATFGLYPRALLRLADVVAFHTGASGAGLGAVGPARRRGVPARGRDR